MRPAKEGYSQVQLRAAMWDILSGKPWVAQSELAQLGASSNVGDVFHSLVENGLVIKNVRVGNRSYNIAYIPDQIEESDATKAFLETLKRESEPKPKKLERVLDEGETAQIFSDLLDPQKTPDVVLRDAVTAKKEEVRQYLDIIGGEKRLLMITRNTQNGAMDNVTAVTGSDPLLQQIGPLQMQYVPCSDIQLILFSQRGQTRERIEYLVVNGEGFRTLDGKTFRHEQEDKIRYFALFSEAMQQYTGLSKEQLETINAQVIAKRTEPKQETQSTDKPVSTRRTGSAITSPSISANEAAAVTQALSQEE